jgi:hypothetical protein
LERWQVCSICASKQWLSLKWSITVWYDDTVTQLNQYWIFKHASHST